MKLSMLLCNIKTLPKAYFVNFYNKNKTLASFHTAILQKYSSDELKITSNKFAACGLFIEYFVN